MELTIDKEIKVGEETFSIRGTEDIIGIRKFNADEVISFTYEELMQVLIALTEVF